MDDVPPPVPSGYISTLPPSAWINYWRQYPNGMGPLPFNNERKFVKKKFDFSPPEYIQPKEPRGP